MQSKHHDRKKEWIRNIFLIVLAVGVVVIFFNLDIIKKGESVFTQTADKKLEFKGDLIRQGYTQREIDRLVAFIKRYDTLIERTTVDTSLQDKYKKVIGSSPILFEVHLRMTNGSTISTPARRTTRKELVTSILEKLEKDLRAYKDLKMDDKKGKTLVNTM